MTLAGDQRALPEPILDPGANVFENLESIANLVRNAGKIKESMERAAEELGRIVVEGSAGGGSVTAKVNGRQEVISIRIAPTLLQDGDVELVEDLVTAAVNDGMARAREEAARTFQSLAGGFSLPPGMFGG